MPTVGVRFRVPPPRRALVTRARLTELLRRPGYMPRLVLIAAPAGFGKTTLLTQWLAALAETTQPPTIAWLPVEAADRDLRHFLGDITASLQQATGAVPQTQALLAAERTQGAEDVLASLVNELDEYPDPVVLALDDFHLADTPEVHQAVEFLLENLPPRAGLAMTSRADPNLPLARLRSRGELIEVRAADLRFTAAEANAFLGDVMGLTVSPEQAAALETRTEGWAAGLQLAGLSARGRTDDLDEFIHDFSGSHRFVLDYLLEEVLTTADDETSDFLRKTAVLEQMTSELCDTVTGRADSQQMLERLEAHNLFVIALDDNRHWYRYHHLFADALRARLQANHPDLVPVLHGAAATWYASNGLLAEAIGHAREANDPELLTDLVEAELPELRKHRRDKTIIDRFGLLDDAQVVRRPLLATFRGWTRMAVGDLASVEPWLQAAEDAFTDQPETLGVAVPAEVERLRIEEIRIVPSTVAVYRASLAQARGDTTETERQAELARELAGPNDHLVHAAGAGFLGLAAWVRGDLPTARSLFEETKSRLEAVGNTADALATAVPVAEMTVALGELDRARSMYEVTIASADAHVGVQLASQADLHVGLATVLREQGDLNGAARELDTARDLGDIASLPENRFRWFAATSDLLRSSGDFTGALEMLDRAEELYLPGFFPDIRPLPARRAQLLLDLGRVDEASAWANGRGLDTTPEPTYRTEYELLTYARLLADEGNPTDASALLDALAELADTDGRTGSLVELLVASALFHHQDGNLDSAKSRLTRAVALGVPAGYRRTFLDHGEPLQNLLEQGLDDPSAESAARALAAENLAKEPSPLVPLQLAAEPLSERELEVLRLLNTDLSGPDISRELYISLNTFRTHTKRIFTKLDVKTRRAAVSRATELGIL